MQYESKRRLTEILSRTGHVLVAEDFDDIIELDQLAAEVADPQSGIDSPLMNHAVYFRGVPVYPLTLAHLTFLDEATALLGLDDDSKVLAMLWATTIKEITDDHYNPDTMRAAFKAWARYSKWNTADIDAVLELRYGKMITASQPDRSKNKDNGDGALIGLLAREYGESPRYWMQEAPLGVIEACVADWNARQESQAESYRRANKGAAAPPAPSPKFVAMRKFRECAERIEAKWLRNAPW